MTATMSPEFAEVLAAAQTIGWENGGARLYTAALRLSGLCGVQVTTLHYVWVCTRPAHGGQHPHSDDWRRRRGVTPSADRHVLERLRSLP